jgi:hypothetical protein
MVFVDHYAYCAPASIFEGAHYAASAVDLHILPRADDSGRQQNREVHHRAHSYVGVHRQ